ncbi:hypothetical protein [Streptomyces nigrescens]|uniref:Uncharacterized protein n=1 Tax=Streptomyces nigrescens TaxID=1920 RepID=A0A640TSG9_STRNI|nr:hypothetical protein [Streptomyces libani]WAT99443.1 hypothetical protein STRLI_005600 [Streptomyces libani subsp. libani]GFE25176.1 hypothetical protein Sliba_56290 [Streptomyces libani subsp. libani]GGW05226.1 hypothetical protein GCM10010500_69020 [Streptomyces libani subsp. libani]
MSAAGAGRREGPVPARGEVPLLRRAARAEWGPLLRTVRAALAASRLRAIPMTLTAVVLTLVFQFVQNQAWGYQTVQNIGSVQADEHLWLALLRTPLSLFVPALDLPVWGALAQILVVFGIAEICVGRRQLLAVAYLATLAGTMYARIGIWIGPVSPLGLPDSDKYVTDTGPSAAVVGLAVFVCWRYRAWFTCAAVAVAMVVEVVSIKNNLAGKEHVAAVLAVLVLCGLCELRRQRKPGPGRQRLGAPPMKSSTLRRSADQRRS